MGQRLRWFREPDIHIRDLRRANYLRVTEEAVQSEVWSREVGYLCSRRARKDIRREWRVSRKRGLSARIHPQHRDQGAGRRHPGEGRLGRTSYEGGNGGMGRGVGGPPRIRLIYILCSLTVPLRDGFQCKVDHGFTFLKEYFLTWQRAGLRSNQNASRVVEAEFTCFLSKFPIFGN